MLTLRALESWKCYNKHALVQSEHSVTRNDIVLKMLNCLAWSIFPQKILVEVRIRLVTIKLPHVLWPSCQRQIKRKMLMLSSHCFLCLSCTYSECMYHSECVPCTSNNEKYFMYIIIFANILYEIQYISGWILPVQYSRHLCRRSSKAVHWSFGAGGYHLGVW